MKNGNKTQNTAKKVLSKKAKEDTSGSSSSDDSSEDESDSDVEMVDAVSLYFLLCSCQFQVSTFHHQRGLRAQFKNSMGPVT